MTVFLLRRLRRTRIAREIVLATTDLKEDDRLARVAAAEGIPVFRGSESDLIDRFVKAAAPRIDPAFTIEINHEPVHVVRLRPRGSRVVQIYQIICR